MIKKNIKIATINHAIEFVRMAEQVEGDVTIYSGRYVIDGKSIMGIFSINLTEGVEVEFSDAATDFADYLSQFEK